MAISNERQRKAYCDVCWFLDGWHGMILQTCKTCNVSVHNECYGREGKKVKKRNPNFQCWACEAVGTTIKVRERDDDDNHVEYKIVARPTECMLCGVDDGYDWMHAMHPIYDDWGLKGRQKVLPAVKKKPKRLGLGHTLCCMTISSRFAFIYGCLQNGSYSGGNARFNLKDDDSINSLLYCADAQSSDGDNDAIHHFVYGPTAPNREINEFKHLKCILCCKNDELATSFRIPCR
jgi:hypothetical protein